MSDWNRNKERNASSGRGKPGARASLFRLERTKELIEFLMDNDGFFEGTAVELATALGWTDAFTGKPDRRLVNDCCTLTRDADEDMRLVLAGCVIAYRPNPGGFVLVDPLGDMRLRQQIVLFKGDMQRQQQHHTENRRRLKTWQAFGDQMATNGDLEFATLCWQIKAEIEKTGDFSDTLTSRFWQMLRSRPEFSELDA